MSAPEYHFASARSDTLHSDAPTSQRKTREAGDVRQNGFMSSDTNLRRGDLVPHFTVMDAAGRHVSYRDAIWQQRELVLVTLPPGSGRDLASSAAAGWGLEMERQAVACVVTAEPVDGAPRCGFLVADRWGEIAVVEEVDSPAALPPPEQLLEWVGYVQRQCPECEGESR